MKCYGESKKRVGLFIASPQVHRMAIVGLTYQFITSQISRDTYNQYQRLFDDEVVRLNPIPPPTNGTPISTEFEGIRSTVELRFTLLRHWSLYDAMTHSSYVANKLSIWKERGRRKLVGLFAKMGYSIPDAQQSYNRIPSKTKEELHERLDQIAPEYGLIELTYPSFVRHYGFQRQPTGAADAVEALGALLDVGGRVKIVMEELGTRNGGEWFSGGRLWEVRGKWREDEEEDTRQEPAEEDEEPKKTTEWWIRNFWVAYDALTK
jgi:cell division control protein 45